MFNKNTCKQRKMHRINLRKKCKGKHERFYPSLILVTYVQAPSSPLEIYLILILIHQKSIPFTPLDKITFANLYNSSLYQEDNNLYNSSQYQEDTLVQLFSLNDYKVSYKSWNLYVIVNKVSYKRTLRILHNGIGIVLRNESGN